MLVSFGSPFWGSRFLYGQVIVKGEVIVGVGAESSSAPMAWSQALFIKQN